MKHKSAVALLLTLVLFLSGYAVMEAQTIKQNFEWVIAKRLTVTSSGITVQNGNVAVTQGVTANDVTAADDTTTADLYLTQQVSQTIGFGGTITPTGAYHQITATAARGTSSVSGVATAGRVVTLINIGSNTITLTDTGTLKLSGNAVLGQYDSLVLLSDGTNWIQLSKTDN